MAWLPDWLTGYDAENNARADATDAYNAEFQRRKAIAWGDPAYQRAADNLSRAELESEPTTIDEVFTQSVKDSASAMSDGINSTLSFSLKKIFGAIPWQLWAVAAVALFLWMGGAALLKGRLAKL